MATGHERYAKHPVWETLRLKRESLNAARFDDQMSEQARADIVEWLDEALRTRVARQPALYLNALDTLREALNQLPVDSAHFRQFISQRRYNDNPFEGLESALKALPLPAPKELKASYVELLDREVQMRTAQLDELETRVQETESALKARLTQLSSVKAEVEKLSETIETQRKEIIRVSESAENEMRTAWNETLEDWRQERRVTDDENNAEALKNVATLAAVTKAGEALAEHAAGALSAADWYGRAKRERRAAQWIRAGALAAFIFAGAVGYFIVHEAIINNFDLSVGDGVLRASIAIVIGAFGALLLREAGRHFREADTSEDVALSLKALAPFYANSDDEVRLDARMQVGDAVLVRNVLSRFSHRDAAKHSSEVNTDQLPGLVKDATRALNTQNGAAANS